MNGATVLTKFVGDTKDLDSKTKEAQSSLGGLTKAFGIGAGVIASAYAVAGKAVIGMTKKAVESAGELEQQIGGTEAVFGDFADTVQEKAKDSFKSMGTSANDYLQTINKMSSILQGSGYTIEESMNTSAEVMDLKNEIIMLIRDNEIILLI